LAPQDGFFNAVAICDRLVCAFDIAICEVIHLTQNKKPIPINNMIRDSWLVNREKAWRMEHCVNPQSQAVRREASGEIHHLYF